MKEKEKRESEPKRLNYKEQIRGGRLRRFYQTFLFVLAILAVSVVFYVQWRNKIYSESVLASSTEIRVVSGVRLMNLSGYIH